MPPEPQLRKEPVAFDQIMEGLLLHAMKGRLDAEARPLATRIYRRRFA